MNSIIFACLTVESVNSDAYVTDVTVHSVNNHTHVQLFVQCKAQRLVTLSTCVLLHVRSVHCLCINALRVTISRTAAGYTLLHVYTLTAVTLLGTHTPAATAAATFREVARVTEDVVIVPRVVSFSWQP
jgi:hypothetical protein